MNVNESREAFLAAIKDIANTATEAGFTAEYKCYAADRDLSAIDEENAENAAIIAAELSLSVEGVEEKVLLECAVSVRDGECTSDEIAEEISLLRQNVKDLTDKATALGAAEAISELFREQSENEKPDEPKVFDNKSFYIGAGILAAVIVIVLLVINSLH